MFLKEPSHWIILAVVVLVLFGGRRLPEAARGIGRSLRIFKSEIRQMNDDDAPQGKTEPVEGRIVEPGAPAQNTQPPVQTPSAEPRRDA